jgi:hypothetical protein
MPIAPRRYKQFESFSWMSAISNVSTEVTADAPNQTGLPYVVILPHGVALIDPTSGEA